MVPGRFYDFEVLADAGQVAALVEQGLVFGNLASNLLAGAPLSGHSDVHWLKEGASGLSPAVAEFWWVSDVRVSRTGACWDNAMSESFCAVMKREMASRFRFKTSAAARRAIVHWVNHHKGIRHGGWINNLSPIERELPFFHC